MIAARIKESCVWQYPNGQYLTRKTGRTGQPQWGSTGNVLDAYEAPYVLNWRGVPESDHLIKIPVIVERTIKSLDHRDQLEMDL